MTANVSDAVSKLCTGGKMLVEREKAETWDKEDELSKEDLVEILGKQKKFMKVRNEFLTKMSTWKSIRKETIHQLYNIASECDKVHLNCNIANVSGASVGAAGGILAIGGLVMAPFTFGVSLGLSAVGGAVGAAGAVTNISTSIAESGIMKGKCKEAQDCLDIDRKETEAISSIIELLMKYLEALDSLEEKINKIAKLEIASISLDSTILAANSVTSGIGVVKSVQALKVIRSFTGPEMSVLKECPKMVKNLKVFKGTALAAGKAASFLAVTGLGLSIWDIVSYSKDIHNRSESEAAKRFRENAKSLEAQMETLCEIESKLKTESA